MKNQLLFVYNANSDFKSKTFDYLHKVFSPNSYGCDLCAISHSNLGERSGWRIFIDSLDYKTTFVYKDQFLKGYSGFKEGQFPLILFKNRIIVTKEEFEGLDMESLQSLVIKKILE